jgi:hypothetical protein
MLASGVDFTPSEYLRNGCIRPSRYNRKGLNGQEKGKCGRRLVAREKDDFATVSWGCQLELVLADQPRIRTLPIRPIKSSAGTRLLTEKTASPAARR